MFGRKEGKQVINPSLDTQSRQQDIIVPVPQPVEYIPQDIPVDEEYEKLAEKLGATTWEMTKVKNRREVEEFKKFLHNLKIITYPLEDVKRFMDNEAKKVNKRWDWQPLRDCDRSDSMYAPFQYQKPVPFSALQKVEKIVENYHSPQNLNFYVSDYEEIRPDPFLAVQIYGEYIVIDHWDEPTFRINT
jgi:hypothetical protein